MTDAETISLPMGRMNKENAPVHAIANQVHTQLHGRQVEVTLTARAQRAAQALSQPLVVEMELYFSCLVRKQVLFKSLQESPLPRGQMSAITDLLLLSFRPVVTQYCHMDDLGMAPPPVETMPIQNPGSFVPPKLHLDYRKGQWQGKFAYRP